MRSDGGSSSVDIELKVDFGLPHGEPGMLAHSGFFIFRGLGGPVASRVRHGSPFRWRLGWKEKTHTKQSVALRTFLLIFADFECVLIEIESEGTPDLDLPRGGAGARLEMSG